MVFRVFVFALIFIGSSSIALSQDLLVTSKNDSINCKVIKENTDVIFYLTNVMNSEITNAIKKSEVKAIIIDYYDKNAKSKNYVFNDSISTKTNNVRPAYNRSPKRQIPSTPGIRIGINYGASIWIFKNPARNIPVLEDYYYELRTGNTISFVMNYYTKSNIGIGLQVMNFNTQNSLENVTITNPNGSSQIGTLKNNVDMTYMGLSFGFRYPLNNKKWRVAGDLGIGYSRFVNVQDLITRTTISSNNVGLNSQIGLDYTISSNVAIGVMASLIRSYTTSYDISTASGTTKQTVPDDEVESLARADVSIGLRYILE